MRVVTRFEAYDGVEFKSPATCEVYEVRCHNADAIIGRLAPLPVNDGCDFVNGGGFIQHDRTFIEVRAALLEAAKEETDHHWIQLSIDKPELDPSYADRIIGECCNKHLRDAWRRIACTDSLFREWGQPYFRSNPSEAKQICLNPK